MARADVVAQGGDSDVTEPAAADESRFLDVGTDGRGLLLDRLELPPHQLPAHSVERALRREAVVLLLDVHGEGRSAVKGLVLAPAQVDLLQLVREDAGVELPRQSCLPHALSS